MRNSITGLLVASAAGLSVLVAATAASAADVKIGFLGGFTGPIETLVPPIHAGAELAVKQVNEQGGILGGGKLVMVQGDFDLRRRDGRLQRRRPHGQRREGDGAGRPALLRRDHRRRQQRRDPRQRRDRVAGGDLAGADHASRTRTSCSARRRRTPIAATMLAKLLKRKGVDNVAITYVNNDYGKGFADALKAAFKKEGGTVAAKDAHEDGKADYRAELGSLASSGAEMLVVLAYVDGSGQTIIRQALEGGDFAKFAGGDGMVGDCLVTAIGEGKLDGFIATKIGRSETPGTAKYAEPPRRPASIRPRRSRPQAYDAAFLIALAIEKNGSDSREGVNEALREVLGDPASRSIPANGRRPSS